jgi:hypothetical protein
MKYGVYVQTLVLHINYLGRVRKSGSKRHHQPIHWATSVVRERDKQSVEVKGDVDLVFLVVETLLVSLMSRINQ